MSKHSDGFNFNQFDKIYLLLLSGKSLRSLPFSNKISYNFTNAGISLMIFLEGFFLFSLFCRKLNGRASNFLPTSNSPSKTAFPLILLTISGNDCEISSPVLE